MLAFAAPAFLWGLLALPVVVALHFMRQARRERVVSALWLWPHEEAPSRKARFSPSLLLFLQLLAVAFASLGAAGPRIETPGRDVTIILDAAGAMAATDVQPSRFEAARREAAGLLSGARSSLVLRAGLAASVLSGPRDDVAAARAALERAAPGDSASDLAGALRLARDLLPGGEVHLFTSGEPPQGFRGVLHQVRGAGRNVGITAFAVRGRQAFASLESNLAAPASVGVSLTRDGALLATTRLSVPAGGRAVWTPSVPAGPGDFRLSITPPEGDSLTLDNTAVSVGASGRVLVSPPQNDVLRAVASVPGVRASTQSVPPATAAGWDAVVLVGAVPRTLPAGQYLVFAPAWAPTREAPRPPAAVAVTSWDASSPLLRFTDLLGLRVRLSDAPLPDIPGGSWTVLARSGDRPFVLYGEGPGVRALYLASHPLDSDLRSSPAFPVLAFNLLSEYLAVPARPLGATLPPGRVTLDGNAATGLD
ncbi:MAG TPA: BatA and WFA domain-containing protein, partial [Deinococcales bacterium]|nr:BatA and WFA domain-containing protein [Deinococcales bacterium]